MRPQSCRVPMGPSLTLSFTLRPLTHTRGNLTAPSYLRALRSNVFVKARRINPRGDTGLRALNPNIAANSRQKSTIGAHGPTVTQVTESLWRSVDQTDQRHPARAQPLPVGSFALESFLPIELRVHDYAYSLSRKVKGPAHIRHLPSLLRRIRARHDIDLIASLVRDHRRYEAARFLMDAIISYCVASTKESPPNYSRAQSFTSFTRHALLGEVWQSLGSLILCAEDGPQEIRTFVLATLADLHHVNVMPSTLYQCRPFAASVPYQRPQTLRLLSSRIVAVLSDVAWEKHWRREMQKAEQIGYELSPPRVQPQISALGSQIWLDLILWTCVEGGWIAEGAWILREMEKLHQQWSVISWTQVCKERRSPLSVASVLKSQLATSRINQSAGINIAQAGNHYIDIPPRTISREVVQAICDGAVIILKDDIASQQRSVPESHQTILVCLGLLHRNSSLVRPQDLGIALLRMSEASNLKSVVHWNAFCAAISFLAHLPAEPTEFYQGHSAALLGLLHDALSASSEAHDYWTCVQILRVIQNIVDANRTIRLHDFARKLSGTSQASGSTNLVLYPQIPAATLAGILELIIENNFESLGRWLVTNDEVDGGLIPESMLQDTNLQPALISFAAAVGDEALLQHFLQYLRLPLPVPVQRALLHCQMRLQRWDAVEKILHYLRDHAKSGWEPIDVAVLASVLIQHESSDQAMAMLQAMLHGLYDPPQDHSQAPDITRRSISVSLVQILLSIPSPTFQTALVGQDGHAFYEVPVDAFNVLLRAVVRMFGSQAGCTFCERWSSQLVRPNLTTIRILVQPVMARIRDDPHSAVSRRSFERGHTLSEQMAGVTASNLSVEERRLINWAVPQFQKLGLQLHDIRAEIQGHARPSLNPSDI